MKNTFYYLVTAVLVSGCNTVRTPDRIEVLHAQPVTAEYEVQKGDTINKIAAANNMDPERLVALNNLAPPYTIAVGQKLKIDADDSDMIVVKQIFYN
jgi:LysM repeat protein